MQIMSRVEEPLSRSFRGVREISDAEVCEDTWFACLLLTSEEIKGRELTVDSLTTIYKINQMKSIQHQTSW